jgi:hypothetical protein
MTRCCTGPGRAYLSAWLAAGALTCHADTGSGAEAWFGAGHPRLALSPWSVHFAPSEEHKPVLALALEWQRDDDWLGGASFFTNSFGQPSGYVYAGQRIGTLFQHKQLFAQWTAGLMYGYRGAYEDKVPFNNNGFSPGAVVALGWAFDERSSAQVNLLGSAGLMFQIAYELR